MSVQYSIRVEKNGVNVTAWYDLRVRASAKEHIETFELSIEGKNLIEKFPSGQKTSTGIRFHTLPNPLADAFVKFAITTNQTWSAEGSDTLEGGKNYDDVSFAN